jgi:hypothetical protein
VSDTPQPPSIEELVTFVLAQEPKCSCCGRLLTREFLNHFPFEYGYTIRNTPAGSCRQVHFHCEGINDFDGNLCLAQTSLSVLVNRGAVKLPDGVRMFVN